MDLIKQYIDKHTLAHHQIKSYNSFIQNIVFKDPDKTVIKFVL